MDVHQIIALVLGGATILDLGALDFFAYVAPFADTESPEEAALSRAKACIYLGAQPAAMACVFADAAMKIEFPDTMRHVAAGIFLLAILPHMAFAFTTPPMSTCPVIGESTCVS